MSPVVNSATSDKKLNLALCASSSTAVATLAFIALLATASPVQGSGYSCMPITAEPGFAYIPTREIEDEEDAAGDILSQIHRIATDSTFREAEEPAPDKAVVDRLTQVMEQASLIYGDEGEIPSGDVALFCGELNVTWRDELRILTLISAPDGGLRIHFGVMQENGPGNYEYRDLAGADHLVSKLGWLQGKEAVMSARS